MKWLVALVLTYQIGTPAAHAKLEPAKIPAKPAVHVGFLTALPAEGRPLLFDNGHALYTLKPVVYQRNHTRIRFHKMDRQISLVFGPKDILAVKPSTIKVAKER